MTRFSEREVNIPSRQRPAEKDYDFRCETRIQVLNHCPLLQPRKAVKKMLNTLLDFRP